MPCYHPLTGYKAKRPNPATGKRSIVFNKSEGFADLVVTLPCGRCIGCRLEYSRQWAIRAMHESESYEDNCSLTLTYDDEHLPSGKTLVKEHHQNFIKLLRYYLDPGPNTPGPYIRKKIRFFYCGEYGEKKQRPHFHTVIFNWIPPDLVKTKKSKTDHQLYGSKILNSLWKNGNVEVSEFNFETAAYIARYMTKKIKGPSAKEHYGNREPEYADASRRPGLGADYAKKWLKNIYAHDEVCLRKMGEIIVTPPPKFYDKILEKTDEELYKSVIAKRQVEQRKMKDHPDSTPQRLKVRGLVHAAQAKLLLRTIE